MELSERDRQVAVWYSVGRAVMGAVFVLRPSVLAGWLGEDARRPAVKALARAFGVRDVALGVGSYLALAEDKPDAARWLQLSAVSDTVDAAATVLAARHLPKRGVALTLAMAAAGAVTGFRLSSR